MKTYYVGLGTSPHDPSLCIVDDKGEILFAEDSERYLQNKRAWCAPPDDFHRIGKLLKQYCEPDARFVIAGTWRKQFFNKLRFFTFSPLRVLIRNKIGMQNFNLLRCIATYCNTHHGVNTEAQIGRQFNNFNVERREFEHHLTHSASACYSSTFSDALSVVMDGMGEGTSMKIFHFKDGQHTEVGRKSSAGSLGQFYSYVCELCGFEPIGGEEWKVMGLAPYGKHNDQCYNLLRQLIDVDDLCFKDGKNKRQAEQALEELRRKPGQPAIEMADLAFAGQRVFSDVVNELLANLHKRGLSDNLVLSGGCALNSAYVGSVCQDTPFKQSFVFCAPGDNGNSVGSALLAYHQDHPGFKARTQVQTPYLGSELSDDITDKLLTYSHFNFSRFDDELQLCEHVAKKISQGNIIAWVQGRAEFGPRALGNRSILADPRNPDVKEVINASVKFREEFRPFAPSILAEKGEKWFEGYCFTPYMERALQFKDDVKAKVPGVVHHDGTGRLQSVHPDLNPRYHQLISAFERLTGVPILLNTSFNVMGKPIVHSVEDAMAVFLTSGIDVLVLGDLVFDKANLHKPQEKATKTTAKAAQEEQAVV